MKGTIGTAAALLLLTAIASLGVAPPSSAPTARGQATRVAVFNLTAVIKGYTKFDASHAGLKAALEPYQAKDAALKMEAAALLREGLAAGTTAERKEEITAKYKALTARIEENKEKGKQVLEKRQGEQLKALYADVHEAARRLAEERGYDLILHYNDPVTDAELLSPANVSRKMQSAALTPVVVRAGIDVGADLVADLNRRASRASGR
jgi:Skp family chaperone for outer membrane proteins